MQLGANTIHQNVGFSSCFTHGGNLPSDTQEIRGRSLQVQHKETLGVTGWHDVSLLTGPSLVSLPYLAMVKLVSICTWVSLGPRMLFAKRMLVIGRGIQNANPSPVSL